MEENGRTQGTVQWFSRVKGYGFVRPDGEEEDVFVHYSAIQAEGYRNLRRGQRIEFAVEDTPKGPQAIQVVELDQEDVEVPDHEDEEEDTEEDTSVLESETVEETTPILADEAEEEDEDEDDEDEEPEPLTLASEMEEEEEAEETDEEMEAEETSPFHFGL